MLSVKAGELHRLAALYERHKQKLFGFLYRLTGDAPTAEDLVQSVFLKIVRSRHTFTGEGEFSSWMFQIGRNAANDFFRSQSSVFEIDSDDDHFDHESDQAGPQQQTESDRDAVLVRQALAKLAEQDREVLIMSRFQEMKYKDIAAQLDCTENAVKMRMLRAMEQFKKKFEIVERGPSHVG